MAISQTHVVLLYRKRFGNSPFTLRHHFGGILSSTLEILFFQWVCADILGFIFSKLYPAKSPRKLAYIALFSLRNLPWRTCRNLGAIIVIDCVVFEWDLSFITWRLSWATSWNYWNRWNHGIMESMVLFAVLIGNDGLMLCIGNECICQRRYQNVHKIAMRLSLHVLIASLTFLYSKAIVKWLLSHTETWNLYGNNNAVLWRNERSLKIQEFHGLLTVSKAKIFRLDWIALISTASYRASSITPRPLSESL